VSSILTRASNLRRVVQAAEPDNLAASEGTGMRTSTLLGVLVVLLSLAAWAGEESESSQAALSKEAKITMEQAQKTALTKEAGKIQSKEIEREKGKLIYSFDIKMADGVHEVNVDAMTGEVVEDTVESAAAEAKEKAADKKQKTSEKAAPPSN
jgi:Peptidase propeptide and YPEB domain